jgi:arylsulfatase A-like enzyme
MKKPNICLIFMDDMMHRLLLDKEVETPNLDKLVARGTTFTHAHNQGAWSGAVCIPSRAMLITGLSLWHARERIEKTTLLGEWLGSHGYQTHFVGKWHNSEAALKRSYQTLGPHAGGFYPSTDEKGDAYLRPALGNNTWKPDDTTRKGHWLEVEGKIIHSSEHWANGALEFLTSPTPNPSLPRAFVPHWGREGSPSDSDSPFPSEERAPGRGVGERSPFFLHVAFHAPHDPRQAPTEYLDKYPLERVSVPPNFVPEHPFDNGDLKVRDEKLAPWPRTPEAIRQHRKEYYAILTHADFHIGRILDALPEDTITVFSGDHGLAVGEHGLMGKQNCYDHSVRIPLVFAGPGIPKNKKNDALIYQNQIFATLCDLVGIPQPPGLENPSLAPLIKGGKQEREAAVFGAYLNVQRMVRTRKHKLIVYPKVNKVQLFDIQKDPWELKNIAAEKPALVKALWARLNTLQRSFEDPLELGYNTDHVKF